MNKHEAKESLLAAEILCIGSELLLGDITNSNARWLASQLAKLGIPHFRQTVIGDNKFRLSKVIIEASKRSRVLITTGGLGPTLDDITTSTIASTFDTPIEENKSIYWEISKKINKNYSISMESIKKQSSMPKGAEVIPNPTGIAPGMIWNPTPGFTIMTFPGVPSEMKEMWLKSAIPWFEKNRISTGVIQSKILHFAGINESKLAESFPELLKKKNPSVAPYASLGEVKLRITAKDESKEKAQKLIQPIEQEIIDSMGLKCYGVDETNLASKVLEILREKDQSLALAESCTGGGLGASLTSIPGSSAVFLGGIICYSNLIKQKLLKVPQKLLESYGAVSPQVAISMAEGAQKLFQSTWTIAISGIAGPSGSEDKKPVGLVEFCIKGPNIIKSRHEKFGSFRKRDDIQKLSVLKALDLLRLCLLAQS